MQPARFTRRQALAAGAGLAFLRPAGARPVPAEVSAELPGARLQGSGRLRFLGLRVYDARLWVGERAVADDRGVPLALELEYLRALEGARIAERSLEEMRRQGEIAAPTAELWLQQMMQIFPDVRERDRLTGVKLPRQSARFFLNGHLRGEVRDGEFARRFFGIWLAPQTSEPALRLALIAGGRS
jgi:hypothetical protein